MTLSDSELLPLKHRRKRQELALLVLEHMQTDPFLPETVTCHVTCHLLQITSAFLLLCFFSMFLYLN